MAPRRSSGVSFNLASSDATELAATLVADMNPADAEPILAEMGASDAATLIIWVQAMPNRFLLAWNQAVCRTDSC